MNLCLVALLVIILLYCCLGTINISEGLSNTATNKGGHNLGPGGTQQHNLGPGGTQQLPNPLLTSGYDPAKAVAEAGRQHAEQEGKEYQREISGECPYGMDKYGYCLDNNAKNKNSNPGKYHNKKSCDNAGFIWNNSLEKCQLKLGPGGTYQFKTRAECENAGYLWNSSLNTCEFNYPGKDGSGTLNQCPEGMEWNHKKKMCVHRKKDKCPSGMHWSKHKMMCEHSKKDSCPDGMKWNSKKYKCVNDKSDSDSDSSSDDSDWESDLENDASDLENDASDEWNKFKSNISKFFSQSQQTNQSQQQPMNQNAGTYPAYAVKQRHEIPPGDENLYILKSEIVPPVCPACPPVIEGGGCPAACKAKCAPCPRPPPIPPCPPCERCPEPQFQCKKVPDYKNIIPGNLPRPLLNDFSQFT